MPSVTESFLDYVNEAARKARTEPEFARLFLNAFENASKSMDIRGIEIRMEERLVKGRSDARVGYVVFEFEFPGKLDKVAEQERSLEEIVRHLDESSRQHKILPAKSIGIVTDGRSIAFVEFDPAKSRFAPVDEYERHIVARTAYRGIEKSLVLFDRIFAALSWRDLSPENLQEDFGPGNPICKDSMRALWESFDSSRKERRIKAFYETWKLLFSLSTKNVVSGTELAETFHDHGIDPLGVKTEDDVIVMAINNRII